jgi:hypothetical protein
MFDNNKKLEPKKSREFIDTCMSYANECSPWYGILVVAYCCILILGSSKRSSFTIGDFDLHASHCPPNKSRELEGAALIPRHLGNGQGKLRNRASSLTNPNTSFFVPLEQNTALDGGRGFDQLASQSNLCHSKDIENPFLRL